jgi:hypothetical protein
MASNGGTGDLAANSARTSCASFSVASRLRGTEIDLLSAIVDYEEGNLDEEGTIALFQYLVDTGHAWRLQGHYGRTAAALIEQGVITTAHAYN